MTALTPGEVADVVLKGIASGVDPHKAITAALEWTAEKATAEAKAVAE